MLGDIGVFPDSSRYYHEADTFTESYLYFAPHAGEYHCGRDYEVARDHLDVCQLMLIDEGELCVEYDGARRPAGKGTLVLLDCRKPHRYAAASDELRMRWFHFRGAGSEAYTNLITQTRGFVFPVDPAGNIAAGVSEILSAARQPHVNAHLLSARIHALLALLTLLPQHTHRSELEQMIDRSVAYIETHFGDADLSNESLAQMSALSSCYFIRQFKAVRGMTPHQYIQHVRIRNARQLLSTTSRSVESIAELCGFSNASHFIMVFKRMTGMTPLRFRLMWK
ncbi:MAG TPA: AraC family transcriptional regulator [Candidatus Butyricicoccus stercorigallinarum]|nr:AraC family transcriptional regulator [Candidatus Butyricicoccus stercorigallinarum]